MYMRRIPENDTATLVDMSLGVVYYSDKTKNIELVTVKSISNKLSQALEKIRFKQRFCKNVSAKSLDGGVEERHGFGYQHYHRH